MAEDQPKEAWQPLTFVGVARFAVASRWRLLTVELVFALTVAVVVVWFVNQGWMPVIEKSINQMPSNGEIRGGRLEWPSGTVVQQEGPFMRIDVRPTGFTNVVETRDLVLAFGPDELKIASSLGLGVLPVAYIKGWIISFNKSFLGPWWGARSHIVLIGLGVLVVITLLIAWSALGVLYMFPVKVFSMRRVSWMGARKLAIAAHLPGVLVMNVAIVLYGLKQLDLVALIIVWVGHLFLPWAYLIFSPILAPKPSNSKTANSFMTLAKRRPKDNPFDEPTDSKDNPFGVK